MGKSYSHWFDKQGKHLKKQAQKCVKQRRIEKENNMPIVTAYTPPKPVDNYQHGRTMGFTPPKPTEPIRSYPTAKNNSGWWNDDVNSGTNYVVHAKSPKTNPVFTVDGISFSGWAKEDVKYFSGGLLISLAEYTVGLPISMPGVNFLEEFNIAPMEQMKILWADFGGCPLPPEIVYKLYQFLLRRKKNVHVHCQQGNGRTGTLLACFAICAGLPKAAKKSPLDWIREHYCAASVESLSQREFLIDFELWFETNTSK